MSKMNLGLVSDSDECTRDTRMSRFGRYAWCCGALRSKHSSSNAEHFDLGVTSAYTKFFTGHSPRDRQNVCCDGASLVRLDA
jgi:hypothetical protein